MVGVPYPDIAPSRLLGNLGRNLPVQSLQCSYCSRGRSKILWISPAVTWSLESGSTCRFRAMSVNEGLIWVLNNKLLSFGISSHAPVGCTQLQQVLRSSFSPTIITTSPTPWTTPISHNPCSLFFHLHLTFLHLPFSPQFIIEYMLINFQEWMSNPQHQAPWKRYSLVKEHVCCASALLMIGYGDADWYSNKIMLEALIHLPIMKLIRDQYQKADLGKKSQIIRWWKQITD